MYTPLLDSIRNSDPSGARVILESLLEDGRGPWAIHEALFPVVQCVLNPPFINPHLPKMYAINRELAGYLEQEDIAILVRVEVEEYARREMLPPIARPSFVSDVDDFTDVEKAIVTGEIETTAKVLSAFMASAGPLPLVKHLLMLGSGYLDRSLGHSISCTAYLLIEMNIRRDEDPWPVMVSLAEYFCKGNFSKKPTLQYSAISDYPEVYLLNLKRAVSGRGIGPLHHTITLYAIEKCRHFLGHQEYDHALTMWNKMLGDKTEDLVPVDEVASLPLPDYFTFFHTFLESDPIKILEVVKNSLNSMDERHRLAQFLIKAVLQCYNGYYNPHYLTGLGAALWVMDRFHEHPDVVLTCLNQYLDFFYTGVEVGSQGNSRGLKSI
ncbi:MAG: hypothetical protein HKP41_23415 [Desulfobacterales bacterium]|nr:hypothetical protein [Desulfobacterales bacterium]